jgi:hypothetical protein
MGSSNSPNSSTGGQGGDFAGNRLWEYGDDRALCAGRKYPAHQAGGKGIKNHFKIFTTEDIEPTEEFKSKEIFTSRIRQIFTLIFLYVLCASVVKISRVRKMERIHIGLIGFGTVGTRLVDPAAERQAA